MVGEVGQPFAEVEIEACTCGILVGADVEGDAQAMVQLVEIILKRYIPALYSALGIYLPLITTNCAVLGVVLLNVEKAAADVQFGFAASMFNSIGAGLGFMLAMVMFSGVRSKMESADIPKFMQGLPITLVAASLVSVSFLGFGGVIENIFG